MDISVGTRCTVSVDYGDTKLLRGKTAVVVKFQQNGRQQFARIRWVGKDAMRLEEEFGTLFEAKDLKRRD